LKFDFVIVEIKGFGAELDPDCGLAFSFELGFEKLEEEAGLADTLVVGNGYLRRR
jgi:hypothetical protein